MRITKETHQVLINNKMQEFLDKAASFLSSRFEKLILSKGITRPILKESVYQCYLWTEHLSYPNQLLAVRIACARLCFGSFFMEDVRYAALRDMVEEHIRTHEINDEDLIHDYIVAHQADWQTDWFSEHLPLIWRLCAARNVIPHTAPEWPTADGIFHQLFDVERRSSFLLPENARQAVFQQLMKSASVAVTTGGDEQVQLLLAIAQYYDGFRCFDDPLRPRWYGMLAPENRPHLPWRLQALFTPGKQEDKYDEQSRST